MNENVSPSPETQEVTPGSPEYDALMAEKFDDAQKSGGQQSQTQQTEERPSWLPEKFKSPEDFAKAYAELEKKQSQAPAQKADEKPDQQTQEEAKKAVEAGGLDFNALEAEYLDGGLSDDSYSKLEAVGIPRDVVDAYIAGQEAVAAQIRDEVVSEVGGEEAYGEMIAWASQNLSPAEIAAYDNAVDSGDMDVIKLAVEGLKARFERSVGSEPRLLSGGVTNSSEGFRSVEEMKTAMRDPRYRTDPAYRSDVERRVASSNLF